MAAFRISNMQWKPEEQKPGEALCTLGNGQSISPNKGMIHRNIEYYSEGTSQGSPLSRLVFSWVQSKYDKMKSWENFEALITSDFKDIQGGTTPEGFHLGAIAGSSDLIQGDYAGLAVCNDALWINPRVPDSMKKISMRTYYRKHWIYVYEGHQKIKISFEEGWSKEVNIGVLDQMYKFKIGEVREFSLLPQSYQG